EDELVGALALGDGRAEGVVGAPELLDRVLERGQVRRGDERVSGDRVDHGTTSEAEQGRRAGGLLPEDASGAGRRRGTTSVDAARAGAADAGPPLVPQL